VSLITPSKHHRINMHSCQGKEQTPMTIAKQRNFENNMRKYLGKH